MKKVPFSEFKFKKEKRGFLCVKSVVFKLKPNPIIVTVALGKGIIIN